MRNISWIDSKVFFHIHQNSEVDCYGSIAVYAHLLKAREGNHYIAPKNGLKGYKLLQEKTGISQTALRKYISDLIYLDLGRFTSDGGFFLVGSKTLAFRFNNKNNKKVPIELCAKITDTKDYIKTLCFCHEDLDFTGEIDTQCIEYYKDKKNYRRKKIRQDSNDIYAVRHRITSLIYKTIIKGTNRKKRTKTASILGCSYEEFKEHLEDNPYGFKITDENIHLDHIVPISSAETEEDVYRLNHWSNFQLLPSEYNRVIKNNSRWDKEDFEKWYNGKKGR